MTKAEIFAWYKNEITAGALNRTDNDDIYIFMKENLEGAEKSNLLIFTDGNKPLKSAYSFGQRDGLYFIRINGVEYEMLLPDAVSDDDPFTLHIKGADGERIDFENYI